MERGWGGGVFDSLLFDLQHGHVLKKLPFDPTLRVGGGGSAGQNICYRVAEFVIPFKICNITMC